LTIVSVVICTYSRERLNDVVNCINSLKEQTLKPSEIILALDKNEALIDFYRSHMPSDIKIVVSEGTGLSNARNAGVKNARGDIIAFIDDDAIADKKWLENLVKNYNDPLVIGAGGLIIPQWENRRPYWFPEELDWIVGCSYKGFPKHKTSIRNPIGCNMSFRKYVFERAGYFKTNVGRFGRKLLAGEEMEFSVRALEEIPASKIIYDPSAVVYHRIPESRAKIKYFLKRSFYEGVSKALIVKSKQNSKDILSSEQCYIRHLLTTAIPERLKRIYKPRSLCQLLVISLSIMLVLIGYFITKIKDY